MRRRKRNSVSRDLAKGAIAGAVATWVMGRVTTYMYEREDEEARETEDAARQGKTAYGIAAEKGAAALGKHPTNEQRQQLGSAIHWALGMGAGATYAVLRRRFNAAGAGAGTAFGTVFWAVMDEGVVTGLGLTPPPQAFPWQTHARGFVGHLTFGTVTDGTLRVLDAII
ncbi:MAG: DUF1440 domain-containing protein [Gemmatimonadales bacterium]|nr:DUF1440 domain-containing protein [Gemmatimonadales bacterium]